MSNEINITVATGKDEMGGVATVINVLNEGGFFSKWNVRHYVSHTNSKSLGGLYRVFIYIKCLVKLAFSLTFRKVGVVHIHMSSKGSYTRKSLIVRLVKLLSGRVIIHLHGGKFQQFYAESSTAKQAHIRKTYNLADAVIVLSSQWLTWAKTIVKDPAKVHVVYNAVPSLNLDTQSVEPGLVLFLGKLGPAKGVDDLIHCFADVVATNANAKLALGGDGDIEKYQKLVEELGLTDHVEFLGWVSGKDKVDWLRRADVYCLPSYREGFPMGVLEAMSSSIPVVATTVGGIPDAITNGVDGCLIEAGNLAELSRSIASLINDRELNKTLASNAKSRFDKHFSQEAVFPVLDEIYKEVRKR
ncbi:glycosyltransferase family 4 protein [Motilimonas pumila]|uniref:Glycosyltransferase family 1 protein n=1 Tax=Motilimonas pumila TaxID=2303987 RepID=A0A418YLK4_9GAMM|nr:glycosyltransferase family 4 protein [Motilimonas pumila]RJG51680.1 glycosyltransferase family 1 protein [Motilimonas pumila]